MRIVILFCIMGMKVVIFVLELLWFVVICGLFGVGKGILIGKLMKDFLDKFGFFVSYIICVF